MSDKCRVGMVGRQRVVVGIQCRLSDLHRCRGRLRRFGRAFGCQYLSRVQVDGKRSSQGRRQRRAVATAIADNKSADRHYDYCRHLKMDARMTACSVFSISNRNGMYSSGLMRSKHLKMDRLEDFSVPNGVSVSDGGWKCSRSRRPGAERMPAHRP
jgi:hypothetical protein